MDDIWNEWHEMLLAEKPSDEFRRMAEKGVLQSAVPEFQDLIGCEQNQYHSFDVWEHTLATLDACPKDWILRVVALFHDIAKPRTRTRSASGDWTFREHEVHGASMTDDILTRLRFPEEERVKIVHLVRYHFIRYDRSWSNAAVRRWVRKVGPDNVSDLCTFARADIVGKGQAKTVLDREAIDELERRVTSLSVELPVKPTIALAINGRDLMDSFGLTPGPDVGRLLSKLQEFVDRNPEANTREILIDAASREVPSLVIPK